MNILTKMLMHTIWKLLWSLYFLPSFLYSATCFASPQITPLWISTPLTYLSHVRLVRFLISSYLCWFKTLAWPYFDLASFSHVLTTSVMLPRVFPRWDLGSIFSLNIVFLILPIVTLFSFTFESHFYYHCCSFLFFVYCSRLSFMLYKII